MLSGGHGPQAPANRRFQEPSATGEWLPGSNKLAHSNHSPGAQGNRPPGKEMIKIFRVEGGDR
ncbi:MAG: hypothetical protein L0332_28330 [Chloroflexi bacterium]|nr:hypothetical protein [Chloroflexota bacterium]MCI0730605.1 hypothetical protein [Chloroflexota bacterium]